MGFGGKRVQSLLALCTANVNVGIGVKQMNSMCVCFSALEKATSISISKRPLKH
jgi:hypothetical protein